MRKVISLMHVSLDGFAAGPNGEMDFIHMDDEIFKDVEQQLADVDTAIYGPITYHMMASYWPTVPSNPNATRHDRAHSAWVEKVDKIVFSKKLDKVEWNNTRLVRTDLAEEIARLKALPGQNLMIFGSPRLAHSFMQLGLVDEYRLTLQPVIAGAGIPFFSPLKAPDRLRLVSSKPYSSGVIGVVYETIRG